MNIIGWKVLLYGTVLLYDCIVLPPIYIYIIFFWTFLYFVLCRRLRHVVCREGLLSSTSDSIVNLANGGFACDTSLPHYWRMLVIFCVSPCDSISSSGSVIGNRALCAGSVAGQHCCSSMGLLCWLCGEVCLAFVFISFGFLLATICVWVWMVCSLHSVTTGSRDRANVPLIIIIIIIKYVPQPNKTKSFLLC